MELLWANVKTLNSLSWLLPYCRFDNGEDIQTLLSERNARGDWYRYYKVLNCPEERDHAANLTWKGVLKSSNVNGQSNPL